MKAFWFVVSKKNTFENLSNKLTNITNKLHENRVSTLILNNVA